MPPLDLPSTSVVATTIAAKTQQRPTHAHFDRLALNRSNSNTNIIIVSVLLLMCLQHMTVVAFCPIRPPPLQHQPLQHQPLQHQPLQFRVTPLFMGSKGDGKKRRKKQNASAAADTSSSSRSSSTASSSTSSSSSSSSSSPSSTPLRVSNHINIPVRHQIRMAQINKELSKQQSGSSFRQNKVERTRYRRTWQEEEIEQKALERKRRGQDPDWDVILNRTTTAPLVIVDGYNIIYKWSRLKKHMLRGDTQRARQLLVDDLENLRSLKGWRIEVVFDGTKRSTVGPLGASTSAGDKTVTRLDQQARADVSKYGVRVVYTGVGIEADSYIESRCAQAKNVTAGEMTGSFIVATDDLMIRLAGQNAGALCMSADRFVNELKAVKDSISHRVEAAVAKVNGHAVRPEKLRGTYFHTFGRGSVLIEDKRNRTKTRRKEDDELLALNLDDIKVEVDENGIPWWAKVPNHTNPYGPNAR